MLFHRDRLARDHRFVDEARSLDDDAIDGQALPRAHQDKVVDHDILDRDLRFLAVTQDSSCLCLQLDELLDRLGGAALGDRLEQTPKQDQGDDHARCLEVTLGRTRGKDLRRQEREHRIEIGRAGAEHHQAAHARTEMAHLGPALPVEAPAGVELDRRGEQQLDPHPAALGQQREHDPVDAGHELQHRDEKQRNRESRGEGEASPEFGDLRLPGRALAVLAGDLIGQWPRRVSGLGNRFHDTPRIGEAR